jgi:hypothetical protein
MPRQLIKQTITLTAGGGTTNLDVEDMNELYTVVTSGSVTLAANVVIQSSGSLYEGVFYEFEYEANISANGNTIEFFGTTMPDNLTAKKCRVTAYYDGSAWTVKFLPSMDETGVVGKNQLRVTPYILVDYTAGATSTATLTEEVLGSVTVSSSIFDEDGHGIKIVAVGRTQANADTKTMRIKSNDLNVINPNQTYIYNSVTTAPNGKEFIMEATIIRKTSTTAHHIGSVIFDQVAPEISIATSGGVYDFAASPVETLTFAFTSTQGTATANNVELDALYVYKIIS